MDITVQIAIIGGLFTLFAALLTSLFAFYRDQLEKRRIEFEETKWALDLYSQHEIELFKVRLHTYPEIFTVLSQVSSYTIHTRTSEELQALADRFNQWGYSEAALCMSPDTHEALFVFRDNLVELAKKQINPEAFLAGPRKQLVELMRRDLNQTRSKRIEFVPLIKQNIMTGRDELKSMREST